mgnify:CR=1 FL=1
MQSTKICESVILVRTSNGEEEEEVTFPSHLIRYCNRLGKIFAESSEDTESGDESSESESEPSHPSSTSTRGSSDDLKRVEDFLTRYSCDDLVEREYLKSLSKERMKGMLLVAEDFGIKILSSLLCTKFVDSNAALDNIYEFLGIDSKDIKDVERAAFKTAMTSGIKIPESCADAWPMLSTTPSSIYSKWKELKEEEEVKDIKRRNNFDGLAFESETITLISSSGDKFVANSKLACELSAHLRHFVNLSDRDSDNEGSDSDEASSSAISQKIKLATSTSTVLQTFLEYANLYEKNGSSEYCISDWESAFLLNIEDEVSSTNQSPPLQTHTCTYLHRNLEKF